jgi:hypothetical protein
MSYKDELRKKIQELEKRITNDEHEKLQLEVELNRLKLAEFEEDIKESREQRLLKG